VRCPIDMNRPTTREMPTLRQELISFLINYPNFYSLKEQEEES